MKRLMASMVLIAAMQASALEFKSDDMTQITWIRGDSRKKRPAEVYFGQFHNNNPQRGPLRIETRYDGSDWIFARRLIFKIDGKVAPDVVICKRDSFVYSGDHVVEWCDSPLPGRLAQALIRAKELKIRMDGDSSYHDIVVSDEDMKLINEVANYWSGWTPAKQVAMKKQLDAQARAEAEKAQREFDPAREL